MHKFVYDIDFVVFLDLPEAKKYKAAHGYNIDCPFCGRKNKMNINVAKNVYSCARCGASGGILSLHRSLKGFATNAEAKKDLDKRYSALSADEKKKVHQAFYDNSESDARNSHAADISERDLVYRAWLSLLPLNPEHISELQSERRGWLDLGTIKKLGYKSYSEGTTELANGQKISFPEFAMIKGGKMNYDSASEKLKFYRLWFSKKYSTIPGFFWNEKRGICSYPVSGCLLIPVRWRHGEISFFQQKYPPLPPKASQKRKENYKKYGRYGSYGEKGCTTAGLECVHYTGFDFSKKETPETVWITEGVLKADIAARLSKRAFIALVGVNAHAQLKDELIYLKENGTKRICVAVDMDYRGKTAVMQALIKICKTIVDVGLECQIMCWNEEYKGIDDFLIATKKGVPHLKMISYELIKKKNED